MYEERKERFSVRDLIIQILFVALFVFLLLWLFPTKGDLSKMNFGSSKEEETNTVLYDRIFNENIIAMKDSAKSYYTTPRLPQNIGDKVSMTLGEMLEKKILLPFTDKNGKKCDTTASYVEITKESDEFIMKVNLKCSKEENYLLVYMGCYDYCSTSICEKNKEDIATPVIRKKEKPKPAGNNVTNITNITNNIINVVCPECCPKPDKPTPTPDVTPTPGVTPTPTPGVTPTPTPDPNKEYLCEYLKVTNAKYGDWSSWSGWSAKEKYATQLQQVKSKTQRTTVTKKVLTGYNVITYKDTSKPIYKQTQVQTGTKTEKKCASYGTKTEGTGSVQYGPEVDQGLVKLYSVPTNTDTVRYVYITSGVDNCTNCAYTNYYIYRKFTRSVTSGSHQVTYCTGYTTVETPLYTTVNVLTGYGTSERKDPVYKNVKSVEDVKYYSTRNRKIIYGNKDIKWDVCENSSLVKDGYSFTGNKKEK